MSVRARHVPPSVAFAERCGAAARQDGPRRRPGLVPRRGDAVRTVARGLHPERIRASGTPPGAAGGQEGDHVLAGELRRDLGPLGEGAAPKGTPAHPRGGGR